MFSRRDVAIALHRFLEQEPEFLQTTAHVLAERDNETLSEIALLDECQQLSNVARIFFDFPIREMTLPPALWVGEHESVHTAVQKMRGEMGSASPQGYIFVGDPARQSGIFTVRDYTCRVIPQIGDVLPSPIGETNVYTRDAVSVSLDSSFRDVLRVFVDNHFRHLPVTNEHNEVVTAITLRDVVEFIAHLDYSRIMIESSGRPFFLWRGDTSQDFRRPGYN